MLSKYSLRKHHSTRHHKKDVALTELLKTCTKTKNLLKGMRIHANIVNRGLLEKSPYVGSTLISMYAKCGILAKAENVFEELPIRDVVSWNAMISGYVQHGQSNKAFVCYDRMQRESIHPDGVTFTCVFKACAGARAIDKGKQIHHVVINGGLLENNLVLANALIDMYAKCSLLTEAQKVLEGLPKRDVISWSALIAGYAQEGQGHEALQCFEQMKDEDIPPNEVTFTCILKACSITGSINKGKQIHDEIMSRGFLMKNVMLGTALVDMYAKCGLLAKAQQVLEELPVRNAISWSALIAGYAKHGSCHKILVSSENMQREGFPADEVIFACILKACSGIGDIDKGLEIHNEIANRGFLKKNITLGNALLDMYVKCGRLEKAHEVLKQLPSRDKISWSILISGYVQEGQGHKALNCFSQMQQEGITPDGVTFTCILRACSIVGDIDKGKEIHDEILSRGLLKENIVLGTALVDMYAKCGALSKAQEVLEELPARNEVSWCTLISGYTQEGRYDEAINCFERMKSEGLFPDAVIFSCILKACSSIGALDVGENIHKEIVEKGLLADNAILGNTLVDMYVKCGELAKAQEVLEGLPFRDLVSWSALIAGYAEEGKGHEAIHCFTQMQKEGISPDGVTVTCILKACASIGAFDKGKEIHDEVSLTDFLRKNMKVGTALVDMYAKCGLLVKARQILEELPERNEVSWSALISGYAQQGQCHEAINCFERMQKEGFSPDEVSFICILKACGSTRDVEKGKQFHSEIIIRGLLAEHVMLGTSLVDTYAKCGMLAEAVKVLEGLPMRNVISWNALIAGYAQEGKGHHALSSFAKMKTEGVIPNDVTFISILKACGCIGAVDEGIRIHDEICDAGLLHKNIALATALVDMYAKTGLLVRAQQVLEELPVRDTISWSALIAGYAQKGRFNEALCCFAQMQREGINPNEVTFLCVLNACSHTGKLDDAQTYYENMSGKYGLTPEWQHHACMAVVFGRAGYFEKAISVIRTMPSSDKPSIWLSLLGACKKWGNVIFGKLAFDQAIQLNSNLASAYVLMANIYSAAGMQEEAEKLEDMRTTHSLTGTVV